MITCGHARDEAGPDWHVWTADELIEAGDDDLVPGEWGKCGDCLRSPKPQVEGALLAGLPATAVAPGVCHPVPGWLLGITPARAYLHSWRAGLDPLGAG